MTCSITGSHSHLTVEANGKIHSVTTMWHLSKSKVPKDHVHHQNKREKLFAPFHQICIGVFNEKATHNYLVLVFVLSVLQSVTVFAWMLKFVIYVELCRWTFVIIVNIYSLAISRFCNSEVICEKNLLSNYYKILRSAYSSLLFNL